MFQWYSMVLEIVNKYDYSNKIRFLVDCRGFTKEYFKNLNSFDTYKGLRLMQECFSWHFESIDWIFPESNIIDQYYSIFNPLINDCVIQVYRNFEDYTKIVPVEYLPDEFGGKAGRLQDIQGSVELFILFYSKSFQ